MKKLDILSNFDNCFDQMMFKWLSGNDYLFLSLGILWSDWCPWEGYINVLGQIFQPTASQVFDGFIKLWTVCLIFG